VTAHQAVHPVAAPCRTLGVAPSGYDAWGKRPLAPRSRADGELSTLIAGIHRESRGRLVRLLTAECTAHL
jgi:hypothetical protein